MNLEKERELFEHHAQKFFTTNEAFEHDGKNYIYDEVKFMWDCWLASAQREGYKMVPVEPTEDMYWVAYDRNGDYVGLPNDIYKAMIGAVE